MENETIEQYGFKRINNSMWRLGNITIQNGYTHDGETFYEKIFNIKKAYKVCISGVFFRMVTTEKELKDLLL
jgi:hypothetical protein